MKTDSLASGILSQFNTPRHSQQNVQRELNSTDLAKFSNSELWQRQRCTTGRDSFGLSDRESVCSVSTSRSKRIRSRNYSMKPLKGGGINKKSKTMDYTNYAYNEAVGRLKLMLADSYSPTHKPVTSSYLRNMNDDSADNYSDNLSVIDRPIFSDISKYLSPSQKSRLGGATAISNYRSKKPLCGFSSSKENLVTPALYKSTTLPTTALTSTTAAVDYYGSSPLKAQIPPPTDSVQAPVEIFNFIEKQEDYIEQLEKESKYCRNELSNLLGKVKDVINENEQLTEHARSELVNHGKGGAGGDKSTTSPSSDSDELLYAKSKSAATPRKKEVKSPRYASAPNIVYEARISELEAELMQANIDLKRVKTENDDLKKKLSRTDPSTALVSVSNSAQSCDIHRKQIDMLQKDKSTLEETIRHLQKSLDEAKSQQYSQSSKRYINDLVQMERSQAEMEVRHLRDELDRQHERVREMQHEMARRLADERANAERRYNNQVDQLGGDLSSQWEQVAKLQLDLERQKRYESDMKRDLANRNSQIEELKMELRANRSTFLADMAQVNAEKQSLEQEITALRLQLDRSSRENKTEAARLNAEINSLRQRLDRADADLLHSKREVLRLNDEIANLEKELAYGEMKNEIRPTKKDLDKRISEMQDKHEMPTTTMTIVERTPTPLQGDQLREEIGAMTVPEIATATNHAMNVPQDQHKWEDQKEIPIETPQPVSVTEKENAYTSRFDDENIWQNISRSIERLDLDWAKMLPLPKLTPANPPAVRIITPPPPLSPVNQCHCQKYRYSNFSRKDSREYCNCKATEASNATREPITAPKDFQNFSKYGSSFTRTQPTTYSKYHKSSIQNSKTQIPQPLKATGADYPFHHKHHHHQQHQHNIKHDFTLDMHHPTSRCSHSSDTHLENHSDTIAIPIQIQKVETTTTLTNNDKLSCIPKDTHTSHTPRRKCHNSSHIHNHKHTHHQHHQHGSSHRSHSRCHSHDRGLDAAAARKTEPLPWLQQHLVLKQTIKTCHKCQTTDPAPVTIETDKQRPTRSAAEKDLHMTTTCCHTQHFIRACCDNKECLKDIISASKDEQDKATNTDEAYRGEMDAGQTKPKKPYKVDINVRLVPKRQEKKLEDEIKETKKEEATEDKSEAKDSQEITPISADDSELYLDIENTEIESTQL